MASSFPWIRSKKRFKLTLQEKDQDTLVVGNKAGLLRNDGGRRGEHKEYESLSGTVSSDQKEKNLKGSATGLG